MFRILQEEIRKRARLGYQKWTGAVPSHISHANDDFRKALGMDLTGILRAIGFQNAFVKWTKLHVPSTDPESHEPVDFEQDQFMVEHLDWSHGACPEERNCNYVEALEKIAQLARKPIVAGLLNRVINDVEDTVRSGKRQVALKMYSLMRDRKFDHESIAGDLEEELSSVGFAECKVAFDARTRSFFITGLAWTTEDLATIQMNMPHSQLKKQNG